MDHVDLGTRDPTSLNAKTQLCIRMNLHHTPTASASSSVTSLGAASNPSMSNGGTAAAAAAATAAGTAVGSSAAAAAATGGDGGLMKKPTLPAEHLHQNLWMNDDCTDRCMDIFCGQQFTLFNRKHHCRACGGIFCSNCSAQTVSTVNNHPLRVCQQCFYAHQLVISPFQPPVRLLVQRKKYRGDLDRANQYVLRNVLGFLDKESLLSMGVVSADFYFASRDNVIWAVHRKRQQQQEKQKGAASATTASSPPPPSLSSSSSATSSAFARYNFSEFLHFVETATARRCENVVTFAGRIKLLLNNGIRICFVGAPRIGKTSLIRSFVGEVGSLVSSTCSTLGVVPFYKRVSLVGDLSSETLLTVYDVAGDERYGALQQLCCQNSHCVVLCYDPRSKMSLIDAVMRMELIEPQLRGQVVVLCGILGGGGGGGSSGKEGRHHHHHHHHDPNAAQLAVTEADAWHASVRCTASLQVPIHLAPEVFEASIQAIVTKIRQKPSVEFMPTPSVLDVLLQR